MDLISEVFKNSGPYVHLQFYSSDVNPYPELF
jgi:hypothetical protein